MFSRDLLTYDSDQKALFVHHNGKSHKSWLAQYVNAHTSEHADDYLIRAPQQSVLTVLDRQANQGNIDTIEHDESRGRMTLTVNFMLPALRTAKKSAHHAKNEPFIKAVVIKC